MSQQNQLNDIGKLKRNFSILFEKMENILVSLIVCISIAILYIYITKPVYLVTANILVEEKEKVAQ